MNFDQEFKTVELLLESDAKTQAVDAFAISLLKSERQMRKIFTHLVFQSSSFSKKDVPEIKKCIFNNSRLYFESFIEGFDLIYPQSLSNIFGDNYQYYRGELEEAKSYRNKIFHGQLTNDSLTRHDLKEIIGYIKEWCKTISEEMYEEISYDGFGRNSFQKNEAVIPEIEIDDINELKLILDKISR